jgi:hypothetical protein
VMKVSDEIVSESFEKWRKVLILSTCAVDREELV